MQIEASEFLERHFDALAQDEVRHNVILSILNQLRTTPDLPVRLWDLGAKGKCAVQRSGYGIVLGNLTRVDAHRLANGVIDDEIPSVLGADDTSKWFVEAAAKHGRRFDRRIPQTIHLLDHSPQCPDSAGSTRIARKGDNEIVFQWLQAFVREAVPEDDLPTREEAASRIKHQRVYICCHNDQPVAMSCVGRVLERGVAISSVYTPPEFRGHGYAGAATAAIVREAFSRGFEYTYLFTDDGNPASQRCYARIGFRPHCRADMYLSTHSGNAKS